MKRIVFFVHYDRKDQVTSCVEYYLEQLKQFIDELVIISHSALNTEEKNKLCKFTPHVLIKKNEGYDFSAWKHGLLYFGIDNLARFDEVILANDSCYGPINGFADLFKTMDAKPCDFWAVSDIGAEDGVGPSKYHLQSYFIAFKKAAFQSNAFTSVMTGEMYSTIEDAITKKEIPLTQDLLTIGLSCETYLTSSRIKPNLKNKIIVDALFELQQGMPLLKRKTFHHAAFKHYQEIKRFVADKNPLLYQHILTHRKHDEHFTTPYYRLLRAICPNWIKKIKHATLKN